jgi:hypothetical protein
MRQAWPEVSVTSSVRANGSVAVGSDVLVDVMASLGKLAVDDVQIEVVAGVVDPHGELVPRRVAAGVHQGSRGGREHFVATVPAAESGRLAFAARAVALRPDGRGPEPGFLVTWEPSA